MSYRYTVSGGRTPPRDNEKIEIDAQGHFTMWRSVGAASFPPSAVGRFTGNLSAEDFEGLQKHVVAADLVGSLSITPPPDASIVRINTGKTQASFGFNEEPEGPWGDLAAFFAELLCSLTQQPVAALMVEVSQHGNHAKLVHLGTEPLKLNLASLNVRAVLWHGYNKQGDWLVPAGSERELSEVIAEPGWSMELPFAHGFAEKEGMQVVAYVTLEAYDGDTAIPVSLESSIAT
jgi:hypothetical protein